MQQTAQVVAHVAQAAAEVAQAAAKVATDGPTSMTTTDEAIAIRIVQTTELKVQQQRWLERR